MPRHVLTHSNGQEFCTTEYDERNRWMRTTWKGFVTAQDGEAGAMEILSLLRIAHAPYLLNDNSNIEGPWFDSVEWLERVWAPQAQRLGLRAVAHVMQPDPNDPNKLIPLNAGRIAFQAEGVEVFYRNIEIKPLD